MNVDLSFSHIESAGDHARIQVRSPLDGSSGAAALRSLLGACASCVAAVDAPSIPGGGFAMGELPPETLATIEALVERVHRDHPLALEAPFEGSDRIAGAVWDGAELLGRSERDALVKLRFDRGCDDLPSHVHASSDRFILIVDGKGWFHHSAATMETFEPAAMRTTPLRKGSIVVFRRGSIHSFSTTGEGMVMLSYHLPFVAFEDVEQYTITPRSWFPYLVHRAT
jgi:hypothetical protein